MTAPTPRSPRFFRTPAELRAWYEANHDRVTELWVGFYKAHTGRSGVDYLAAVDEALCFGWIDTTVRRLDDDRYAQRFTPRRAGSAWSAVNREKFARLRTEGRMHPAGEWAFSAKAEGLPSYSFTPERKELSAAERSEFQSHPSAWARFNDSPPGYRRLAGHWIGSAVKPETRAKRLRELIDASERGTRPRPFLVARAERNARPSAGRTARRRARPGALK